MVFETTYNLGDSVWGCKYVYERYTEQICPTCVGSGQVSPVGLPPEKTTPRTCPQCDGHGVASVIQIIDAMVPVKVKIDGIRLVPAETGYDVYYAERSSGSCWEQNELHYTRAAAQVYCDERNRQNQQKEKANE